MGLGGSTTQASASKNRQFGEEPVQRREVNSSPGKGRRISLLIDYPPPKRRPWWHVYSCHAPRLSWTRVDSPPNARKMFPTVEFQHRTEGEVEKIQNSVALAILTVDSVLRVSLVLRDWRLSESFQLAMLLSSIE